jgi:hypothetical protein
MVIKPNNNPELAAFDPQLGWMRDTLGCLQDNCFQSMWIGFQSEEPQVAQFLPKTYAKTYSSSQVQTGTWPL